MVCAVVVVFIRTRSIIHKSSKSVTEYLRMASPKSVSHHDPHPNRFAGQVAIVTGGASGIGEATCRRLVAEGADVVIADVNGEKAAALAAELGPHAIARQFDASEVAAVESLVAGTIEQFGRLDVLHNNAAISSPEVH